MNNKIKVSWPITASFLDYPDNESLSLVVYVLGCEHNCKGCHNPNLQNWNYDVGVAEFTLEEFQKEINFLANKHHTDKVVFGGGDPLYPKNIEFVKRFLNTTKYDVCVYTGYGVEYVIYHAVKNFKFIKCGKYNIKLSQKPEKTDDYFILASKNQKLYDSNLELLTKDGIYYY